MIDTVRSTGLQSASPRFATLATAATAEDGNLAKSWSFEMKWDGVRAIAGVAGGTAWITSSSGRDVTQQYPELQEPASLAADGSVLDGEIVAVDKSGRPNFGLLQSRMKLSKPRDIAKPIKTVLVQLTPFDALQTCDGGVVGPLQHGLVENQGRKTARSHRHWLAQGHRLPQQNPRITVICHA